MLITEKAMLARLKVSRWGASKHDKAITEQIAAQHGADPTMGRYSKRLIAKERLETIRQIAYKARHHYYEHTLPWLDDGARVLPAALYFDYMQKQNELKAEFETAVAEFIDNYPTILADAQNALGTLFDPADYPDERDIARKFSLETGVDPMPTAEDFRVSLSEDENARIREQIQVRLDQGVEGAMQDVYQRMFSAVSHMVERLRAYEIDENGKAQNTFRDSLVDNVRDLVELLPKLNITGSNQLEDMRHRLSDELCQIDAWDLRQDAGQRNQVAASAEAILAEIENVMA
jgi:hypothetical protein